MTSLENTVGYALVTVSGNTATIEFIRVAQERDGMVNIFLPVPWRRRWSSGSALHRCFWHFFSLFHPAPRERLRSLSFPQENNAGCPVGSLPCSFTGKQGLTHAKTLRVIPAAFKYTSPHALYYAIDSLPCPDPDAVRGVPFFPGRQIPGPRPHGQSRPVQGEDAWYPPRPGVRQRRRQGNDQEEVP
jgi:hypothetical protein